MDKVKKALEACEKVVDGIEDSKRYESGLCLKIRLPEGEKKYG